MQKPLSEIQYPFQKFEFPNVVKSKVGIYHHLGKALALLPKEDLAFINSVVEKTLNKRQ